MIGGPNAASMAGGLADILPFVPTGAARVNTLSELASFALHPNDALEGETLIVSGEIAPEARVLASSGDNPLIVRRSVGAGTVDYLTVDPLLAPLINWTGRADLWQQLIVTAEPRPFWTQQAVTLKDVATAMSILPGVDLLPPVGSVPRWRCRWSMFPCSHKRQHRRRPRVRRCFLCEAPASSILASRFPILKQQRSSTDAFSVRSCFGNGRHHRATT